MSLENNSLQHKTITVDLSKLSNTDLSTASGKIDTAGIAAGNTASKPAYFGSLASLLGLKAGEGAVIQHITVTKSDDSATVVSSAVTNVLTAGLATVTAGLESKTPTVTQASEIALASLLLDSAGATAINAKPITGADFTAGQVDNSTGYALPFTAKDNLGLVIYNGVVTAELATATLVGKVNIQVSFRKTNR